jgi:AbiV family abortive infection protein
MSDLDNRQIFLDSARECCTNAKRLLSDAQMVEFEKPKATHYFLSVIAQEEAAKAFLLYLVSIEAIPWSRFLLRATRDHHCKQLVGIILDYLAPDFDKWMREMELFKTQRKLPSFPKTVADALNILYHEKIRRWENDCWFWEEDPEYDKFARDVADGKRERAKQQGLYVNLGRNGQIASLPTQVTNEQADEEFERAERYQRCVRGLVDGSHKPFDFETIAGYFKGIFGQTCFIEA